MGGIYELEGEGMDREMGEWAVSIRGRDLLINTRVNTEKGEEPSA